jgi:hypothetical protein
MEAAWEAANQKAGGAAIGNKGPSSSHCRGSATIKVKLY